MEYLNILYPSMLMLLGCRWAR